MIEVIPRGVAPFYGGAVQLLDDLVTEHERIERVAASLRGFVAHPGAIADDARAYVRFFQSYAGEWHHEREEEVLIPVLTGSLELPSDRGPIAVLLADHARMALTLEEMRSSAQSDELFDPDRFRAAALLYTESLLAHIDVENSVFFPECETRLRRGGVADLPSRGISPDELEAAAIGDELVLRYPPVSTDDLVRGEGCVMCPSFYATCSGIEREWWNEWEWEEFAEHVAAS